MVALKQNILLIYDRNRDEFREKSEDIQSVEKHSGYAWVTYKSSTKIYKYNPEHVVQQMLVGEINISMSDVFIAGELQTGIDKIGDYHSHYAIIYKYSGKTVYIHSRDVVIKRSSGKPILAYLSGIAACMKEESGEETETNSEAKESFLASQVKKISLSKETVLSNYLNGSPIVSNPLPETFIYPFSVNTSQKAAVKRALGHNISIIQGPPGTGKTQSILNLIANLIYNGKSVGIVSNNNSAVENVKEKLCKEGYGFLMAHLGKKENREHFFETVDPNFKPDPRWQQDTKTIQKCMKKLHRIGQELDKLLQSKEELAKCEESLTYVERESKEFFDKFGNTALPSGYNKLKKWNSDKLLTFKSFISYFPEESSIRTLPFFIYSVLTFGKPFTLAIKTQDSIVSLALDTLIYQKKTHELKHRISELKRFIDKSDLKQLSRDYADISTVLFKNSLYRRYAKQNNLHFTIKNYMGKEFAAFTDRFPVILSTTHSILSCVSKPLDYIIIDESSQVDIITASLAFSACRNVVIVGDSQQLPHIVTDDVKKKANELAQEFNISPPYDYVKNNIIGSLEKLYGDTIAKTLLREHYRCNPLIIGFCNQKYYKGELIIMKEGSEIPCGDKNYPVRIFRTVEGFHAHSNINDRQIAVIEREVLPQCIGTGLDEIGIISPFRKQADKIATHICRDTEMESDTIHKFQGREKKRIIFSTVANEIIPFMDSAELINVAVSRAIEQFIMVMPHSYEIKHGSNIGDLIRYIERWNPGGAVNSKIISYFDLLNPGGHSKILRAFKRTVKGESKHESENIINTLICEVLNEEPAYSGIKLESGYSLYLMKLNKEGLNKREIDFCNHPSSHVDFLLINRCDNSVVMAIEVDGYTYHSNPIQKERDAIKDKVLAQNGIELLRLSTRGESEKDKIKQKLKELTQF